MALAGPVAGVTHPGKPPAGATVRGGDVEGFPPTVSAGERAGSIDYYWQVVPVVTVVATSS